MTERKEGKEKLEHRKALMCSDRNIARDFQSTTRREEFKFWVLSYFGPSTNMALFKFDSGAQCNPHSNKLVNHNSQIQAPSEAILAVSFRRLLEENSSTLRGT